MTESLVLMTESLVLITESLVLITESLVPMTGNLHPLWFHHQSGVHPRLISCRPHPAGLPMIAEVPRVMTGNSWATLPRVMTGRGPPLTSRGRRRDPQWAPPPRLAATSRKPMPITRRWRPRWSWRDINIMSMSYNLLCSRNRRFKYPYIKCLNRQTSV